MPFGAHRNSVRDAVGVVPPAATEDVAATVEWLENQGFVLVEHRGPDERAFGDQYLRYSKAGQVEVHIVRDRGQWGCDIQCEGWTQAFDFGLVLDAVEGRSEWEPMDPTANPYATKQLPAGVTWSEALPVALGRLASHPENEAALVTMRRRRYLARITDTP